MGGEDAIDRVAVVGCGTIGASWAALFLAHGVAVTATDPAPDAEGRLRAGVARALGQLGAPLPEDPAALRFTPDLAAAVAGAGFVQENAPEVEDLKRGLIAAVDRLAPPGVLIASSTTAMLRSRLAADCAHPGRVVVGHPFTPPHLVPLVEVVAADEAAAARASAFYRRLGRHPVTLRREVQGHLANRLAAALYREAVSLVAEGVASVADVDAAICHGPGLRWALMGPHMTYHLGGGSGGIARYLDHLGPSQERRWADLGRPTLDADTRARIVAGVAAEAAGRTVAELEERRDRGLIDILGARTVVAPGDG